MNHFLNVIQVFLGCLMERELCPSLLDAGNQLAAGSITWNSHSGRGAATTGPHLHRDRRGWGHGRGYVDRRGWRLQDTLAVAASHVGMELLVCRTCVPLVTEFFWDRVLTRCILISLNTKY